MLGTPTHGQLMGDVPDRYRDADRFSFGHTPALADDLLALVIAGVKTTTTGRLCDFGEAAALPEVGRRDVVLDGAGEPRAVIETLSVRIGPASSVTDAHAIAEGEGETCAADWLRSHGAYFARLGDYDPSMDVVFERFRLVEVFEHDGD